MKKNGVLIAALISKFALLILYSYKWVLFDFEKPIHIDRFSSFASMLTVIFSGIGLYYVYKQI